MPQIKLHDPEKGNTYIEVTEEDAKRAYEDLQYPTYLLNKYLNSQTTSYFPDSNPDSPENVFNADTISTVYDVDNGQTSLDNNNSEEKDSFRWPHEAILLLLRIYPDYEHQLTNGKITHKKFWDLLSSQLITNGYNVTGLQCKSKMAGLKNTYKNIKDHNAKSGNSRRTWKYLDIMNEMFIKKPWAEPLLTLESSSSGITSDEEMKNIASGSQKSNSPSCEKKLSTKRKRNNTLEKMIEENAATRLRMHEEAMSRQDKLLTILEKFLQQ